MTNPGDAVLSRADAEEVLRHAGYSNEQMAEALHGVRFPATVDRIRELGQRNGVDFDDLVDGLGGEI